MNFIIIGLPNVGKTSIYNLITDNDFNIIHKTTGTTRDWHKSTLIENENIKIYDTPGIIFNKKNIINKNLTNLIKKIDIFLYVIDYKNKNYLNDKELLNNIRKYNKEIILIINKDDNYDQNKDLNNLGISKNYYISCSHKLGITELIQDISKYNLKNIINNEKSIDFSIAIYGKTNVGKSTLLNKLVGFNRSLVSNIPKTTTDIVTSEFKFKNNNYLIKDTAGLIKKSKIDKNSLDYYATKKTLSIIKKIDLNIFLIDVNQGFDNQSKKILDLIYQKSNTILFVINKIDLILSQKKQIIENLKKDIFSQFSQSKNIYILPISALNRKDVLLFKNLIHKIISLNKIKISTAQINKWLKNITDQFPHSRIKGKEVKFKYATQVSSSPMTIKIFSNYTKEIKQHYKNFLLNKFCDHFQIKSKMIKIIFSKSKNPFN